MQEVRTYKEQLKKEQWSPSENLPDGWMYKVFEDALSLKLKLLGRGGQLFENMNEAVEFVEEYQAYFRKDDMMKIFLFREASIHTPDQKDFTNCSFLVAKYTSIL